MKKQKRALHLDRETIRPLTGGLDRVAGGDSGVHRYTWSCSGCSSEGDTGCLTQTVECGPYTNSMVCKTMSGC